MDNLIAALQIFGKYTDEAYPTYCNYDELWVRVKPCEVSEQDKAELERLSFRVDLDAEAFYSFRFGAH